MRTNRTGKIFRIVCMIVLLLVVAEIVVWSWMSKQYDEIGRTYDADLRIERAVLYLGREDGQQGECYLTASLHNNGSTTERYLPNLYVTEETEPYIKGESLVPVSYYEAINAAGASNFDYYLCIPPGQTVEVFYTLTEQDCRELETMQQNGGQLYVYLPEQETMQPVCVPLQFIKLMAS